MKHEFPEGIIPESKSIIEKIEADKEASGDEGEYRKSEYGHLLLNWVNGIEASAVTYSPEKQKEYLRSTALYTIRKMGPKIIPLLREELRAVLTEEELAMGEKK